MIQMKKEAEPDTSESEREDEVDGDEGLYCVIASSLNLQTDTSQMLFYIIYIR